MSTVVIVGVRRSGTTIFWEWFRQDPYFRCFDEPFNEHLINLPRPHPKGVTTEYQALIEADPRRFWEKYAPIVRSDEFVPSLTERQREYLGWLVGQHPNTVVDVTRCAFKLGALRDVVPDAVVLHLERSARAVASSHLVPTRRGPSGRLVTLHRRRVFWTRTAGFDYWGLESLIGTGPGSQFGLLLDEAGYDVDRFYELPAVGRLLVYLRYVSDHIEATGSELFGPRYRKVSFERFAERPDETVREICDEVGIRAPTPTGSLQVRPPSPGHRPTDEHWARVEADARSTFPDAMR